MVALHIAGLPVEEVLLAAVAAASPLIALIGWEISSWVKRLKTTLRRRGTTQAVTPPEPP
jgi:hypothetical protein